MFIERPLRKFLILGERTQILVIIKLILKSLFFYSECAINVFCKMLKNVAYLLIWEVPSERNRRKPIVIQLYVTPGT